MNEHVALHIAPKGLLLSSALTNIKDGGAFPILFVSIFFNEYVCTFYVYERDKGRGRINVRVKRRKEKKVIEKTL